MRLPSYVDPDDKGITVQVLPIHPHISTSVRWVHNLLEKEPSNLARYDYQPKPAGWGNGGGGLEFDDEERLRQLFPNHPILTDKSLTDVQSLIIAGGIREFVHETGLPDITIRTDYPGVFLYDYKYRDWIDKNGVIHPGGHRKITLWGQLNSFVPDERLHIERHEVDQSDWFDTAISLPKLFFNRFTRPDWPYWSHVFSTVIGLLRIYRYQRSIDEFTENVPEKIHPTWWYILQIGSGDPRFPKGGYRPSPSEWYELLKLMVTKKMEIADEDFLFNFVKRNLDNAKRREEQEFKILGSREGRNLKEVSSDSKVTREVQNSEDSDRLPVLEELREKWYEEYNQWVLETKDAEYVRWLEEDMPEDKRVLKPTV